MHISLAGKRKYIAHKISCIVVIEPGDIKKLRKKNEIFNFARIIFFLVASIEIKKHSVPYVTAFIELR